MYNGCIIHCMQAVVICYGFTIAMVSASLMVSPSLWFHSNITALFENLENIFMGDPRGVRVPQSIKHVT